ncbi:MAG: FecR domain-containing protein [Deltaproteobacteria bacterium]|nr:FecR domain-containing protein [Deltaproteobacteria bacterium]
MNHPVHHQNAFEKLARVQEEQLLQIQPSLTRTKNEVLSRLDAQHSFLSAFCNQSSLKWGIIAAAVLAVAGATTFFFGHTHLSDSATVKDTPSHWIVATAQRAASHEFSDGSSIVLSPKSSARVLQSTPHSVRISLENGEITTKVIHATQTNWLLEAGPYTVRVTGTHFSLGWDADSAHFSLSLRQGSVLVKGPLIEEGKRVQTGERMDAWPETKRMEFAGTSPIDDSVDTPPALFTDIAAAKTIAPSSQTDGRPRHTLENPVGNTATRGPDSVSSGSSSKANTKHLRVSLGNSPANESWETLCSRGEFQTILTLAQEKGLQRVFQQGTLADLMALGEAARLTRHATLSNDVYLAIRQRFAGTPQSSASAFYLGKIAFDQSHAYSRAAEWLNVYIREAPGGPFARDALGKLIESQLHTGQRHAAAQNATQYMDRYPGGPHVTIAQKALGAN